MERDLVLALVDNSLAHEDRATAEARVLECPGGRETLERQRQVATLVARVAPTAPDHLRARVASQLTTQNGRASTRPRVARPWFVGIGGAAIASVTALVLLLSVGSGGPSVAQAAQLSARVATAAPPSAVPGNVALLDTSLDGLDFPNWAEFGWHAIGARSDRLDGRRTVTVFYGHQGHRVGYTVVSGQALELPEDARLVVENGVEVWLYRDGVRDVAVFERDGRTCILAGRVLRQSTLVKLASWTGRGSVEFADAGAHIH